MGRYEYESANLLFAALGGREPEPTRVESIRSVLSKASNHADFQTVAKAAAERCSPDELTDLAQVITETEAAKLDEWEQARVAAERDAAYRNSLQGRREAERRAIEARGGDPVWNLGSSSWIDGSAYDE